MGYIEYRSAFQIIVVCWAHLPILTTSFLPGERQTLATAVTSWQLWRRLAGSACNPPTTSCICLCALTYLLHCLLHQWHSPVLNRCGKDGFAWFAVPWIFYPCSDSGFLFYFYCSPCFSSCRVHRSFLITGLDLQFARLVFGELEEFGCSRTRFLYTTTSYCWKHYFCIGKESHSKSMAIYSSTGSMQAIVMYFWSTQCHLHINSRELCIHWRGDEWSNWKHLQQQLHFTPTWRWSPPNTRSMLWALFWTCFAQWQSGNADTLAYNPELFICCFTALVML